MNIADSVRLDEALMMARFLQVDCTLELEAKHTVLEARARASSSPKPGKTVCLALKLRATSKDKKQQCDFCGKEFATAKHLEDHRAILTGRNPLLVIILLIY